MSAEIFFEEQNGKFHITPNIRRFDAAATLDFKEQVLPKLEGHLSVVVSLKHVTFVDSSGLGCLVSLLKRMPAGSSLFLADVAQNIRSLLKMTRLDLVFSVL
jgi:anti-sigma B factor antagonist